MWLCDITILAKKLKGENQSVLPSLLCRATVQALEQNYASELIAKHMATFLGFSADSIACMIEYPPEPKLVLAAREIWKSEDNREKAFEKLRQKIILGLIDLGSP